MNAVIRAKRDLIFSVSVFGTIGIFVRWIGLPSSVIALVRGAVGAAFLLLLARFRHAPIDRAALRRRWQLLLLSAAMMSFNWITLFEAYRYTTVATATLCYYMAPIFVTLISPVLLRERLTARKLLCVFLALAGMVFVSGVPQSGLPGPSEAKGILLALCSAALYAGVILINKYLAGVPAYDRTLLQLACAAAVMIPYILLTEDLSAMSVTPLGAVLLLIVAVFHTGWCYALYFGSMTVLSAQTVALFSYIDPIVAILLSALLLREPLGWSGILGAALVLGSTLVSELPVPGKG
ncbi:DMT family transporter [uncultured Dysosmobacter sp.]|uniref:DMT family transporter n=1 Tax=uncultured Dysosmobacter sp. TaxID=2591384 RepID=UPI0026736C5F|nr:DMT family transporter [uncultured Dysosmobacter sp.]